MVTAGDIRMRVVERPFQPFRLILKDGRQFDVRDPTWNLVGEPVLLVGVGPREDVTATVPDRHEWIEYQLIDRVEALPVAKAAG